MLKVGAVFFRFQQAVNGAGAEGLEFIRQVGRRRDAGFAQAFGHACGGFAGRGSEGYFKCGRGGVEDGEQFGYGGCFAGAGTAGDDGKIVEDAGDGGGQLPVGVGCGGLWCEEAADECALVV